MCYIELKEVEGIVGRLSAGDFEGWYDEWESGYESKSTGQLWEEWLEWNNQEK